MSAAHFDTRHGNPQKFVFVSQMCASYGIGELTFSVGAAVSWYVDHEPIVLGNWWSKLRNSFGIVPVTIQSYLGSVTTLGTASCLHLWYGMLSILSLVRIC